MQWLATARKDRCQEAVVEVAGHYQVADHQRTLVVDGRAHHQEEEEDHQDRHLDHHLDLLLDLHLEDEETLRFPIDSCIEVSPEVRAPSG